MFSSIIEKDHLLSLSQAKEKLKTALSPRIKVYEERLKKPWLQRGLEYLDTGYGEKGYKRTKDFLADMDKNEITSTEDLIRLIATDKYQEGQNMRFLLRRAVVEICQFNNDHLLFVENAIKKALLEQRDRFGVIILANIEEVAINTIYEKIIAANDFGKSYLEELGQRLLSTKKDFERSLSFRW